MSESKRRLDFDWQTPDEKRSRLPGELYGWLFRGSRESVSITRLEDGTFLDVTRGFEEVTGYLREEVIGRTSEELGIWKDSPGGYAALVRELRTKGKLEDFGVALRTKNGDVRHCLVTGKVLRHAGQEYSVALTRDVTAEVQAREAARASEQHLQSLLRTVSIGISATRDRKFTEVNDAFCKMLRRDPSELIGQDARICYATDDEYNRAGRVIRLQILALGTGIVEARMQRSDGKIIDVLIRSVLIDPNDPAQGTTFAVIDITDRREAEEKLKHVNEQLKMGHDTILKKNIALKEVLDHIEAEKANYKHEICDSIEKLITPIVTKLDRDQGQVSNRDLAVLRDGLDAVLHRDIDAFAANMGRLSPRELDVCQLIRWGLSSKEISGRLNLSLQTVHKHRKAIRRKLQLIHRDVNLAAYLRSR